MNLACHLNDERTPVRLEIKDLETIDNLREWVDERLWPAKVELDSNGEVIIRTGLTVEMNGVLLPLEQDEQDE